MRNLLPLALPLSLTACANRADEDGSRTAFGALNTISRDVQTQAYDTFLDAAKQLNIDEDGNTYTVDGQVEGDGTQGWTGIVTVNGVAIDSAPDYSFDFELGYVGASHKNCKGIVKGIANAALLADRRRQGFDAVLTGEDLCNLGPVAMLQDLAVTASLGIRHVERNGHHYYRGLSMFPEDWQKATLAAHGDLYRQHDAGFACLRIAQGRIDLRSVVAAPFGVQPVFDPSVFPRLEDAPASEDH